MNEVAACYMLPLLVLSDPIMNLLPAVCYLLPLSAAVRSGGDSHYFKSFLLYWILSPLPLLAFHFRIPSLLDVLSL
jgi:hypothetical protein